MGSYYASPRFLNMVIVHPQRPASPPLFFFILPGEGEVRIGLATGHTFLTLATPNPNAEGVDLLALVAFSHFLQTSCDRGAHSGHGTSLEWSLYRLINVWTCCTFSSCVEMGRPDN